jgi:Na+/H+ antiporter NhaD/arsenite permease-like protein
VDPVLLAFALVYVGMALGRLPGLLIDRAGVALLGAIVLLACGVLDLDSAWRAVDASTLALLVALMVVSAQLRLSGFYALVVRRTAAGSLPPQRLLLAIVLAAGALSALLANDVVCLAMAPVVVDACRRRGLDPVPFLLGLAAASNVGSAATLIGNPQNMLIGQRLGVPFGGYLVDGVPPALLGCLVTWWILCRAYAGRFEREVVPSATADVAYDRWQTYKGLAVLLVLVGVFLATDVPRGVAALVAAGVLLLSRRVHSHHLLALVDWQLCVLFLGLFVVNHALVESGATARWLAWGRGFGLDPAHPAALFGITVVGSNVVSNVPAVMLLLPAATHPQAGAILALASTLAGNLLLVGSIANLIVVEQALRLGVVPSGRSWFWEHVRVGVPITVATLALAAGWLALRAGAGF